MRITNAMMTNTTLINISRNMRYLDKLIQQIESTKKIRVPSDDPIVASRALKFRTNVSETEQFQRNVQSGLAWMDVSESSFINIVEKLLYQIRTHCVEAATGTETYEDKNAIVADLRGLIEQIGHEMNQTYAGRYVFSGFRTDEPPVLIADNNKEYMITQTFTLTDIEKTKSFQKVLKNHYNASGAAIPYLPTENERYTNEPVVHDINVLKLAYKNVTGLTVGGYQVFDYSADDIQAYDPEILAANDAAAKSAGYKGAIHYIPETGELIMSNDTATAFSAGGVDVTYTKSGFSRGELNPLVYFDCREIVDAGFDVGGNTYQLKEALTNFDNTTPAGLCTYTLSYTTSLKDINDTNPAYIPVLPRGFKFVDSQADVVNDGDVYFNAASGELIMNQATAEALQGQTFTYAREFQAGEVSPATNTRINSYKLLELGTGNTPDPNRHYDMDGQNIQFEFATNTFVDINSLSKDVYTDNMYADLLSICNFALSLEVSDEKLLYEKFSSPPYNLSGDDLDAAVSKQQTDERAQIQAVLYDRFNNMLYLVDRHSANAMKEHTQLGSRMNRLDLLQARLEQDEVSYTKLLSDNEDTDLTKAIVLKAAAEAAYMASLKAGANIVQMTLANFIG